MHNLRDEFQLMTRRLGFLNRNCCQTEQHELSLIQSSILYEVERNQPIAMQEAAASLGTDITTFSRQVQSLSKLGLLKKTPAPDDRRIQLLSLTAEGSLTAKELDDSVNAYLQDVFDHLNEQEQEMVIQSIRLLNKAMLQSSRCCTPLPG